MWYQHVKYFERADIASRCLFSFLIISFGGDLTSVGLTGGIWRWNCINRGDHKAMVRFLLGYCENSIVWSTIGEVEVD